MVSTKVGRTDGAVVVGRAVGMEVGRKVGKWEMPLGLWLVRL